MANLNKVLLIGRLTRDPEVKVFSNGGKVAHLGFAVNNRRKNMSTGQWEDEPVFLDVDAFNRQEGRRQLADIVESHLRKGSQIFIEGHLKLEQWTDREGQKRQKLKIVMDTFEFLEPRGEGGGMARSAQASQPRDYESSPPAASDLGGGSEGEIPF